MILDLLHALSATATLPGEQRRLHRDSAALGATKAIVVARERERRSAAARLGWERRGVDRG